jgi:DNA-binding winged helix-turn-helix (wHTH) protein/Tol biopolymer transport system component
MAAATKVVYEFGPFRVDPEHRMLLREGQSIPITPKAFDTLLILVQHSREVVSKDELMKMVWPDAFVEEGNLSQNIFMLRKALGDSRDERKYIITLPGCGYRFAVDVRTLPHEDNDLVISRHSKSEIILQQTVADSRLFETKGVAALAPTAPAIGLARPSKRLSGLVIWLTLAGLAVTALLLLVAGFHRSAPRVVRITQLTNSGKVEPWGRIRIDGSKIYFLERHGSAFPLMQVSTMGGVAVPAKAPFPNTRVLDVSPDGAELLVASFTDLASDSQLWIMDATTGSLRKVGIGTVHDAAWYPDGKRILCSRAAEVFSVAADGTDRQSFFQVPGRAEDFAWRPDGQAFRFSVKDPYENVSLWEASPSVPPRKILAGTQPESDCCGIWTPDARFFIFASARGGEQDVWALPEPQSLSLLRMSKPQRLTDGPHSFLFPRMAAGKRIFVIGLQYRVWESRYDAKEDSFVPYGPEASFDLAFSPDHQWVAYVGRNGLWRSRIDGSESLQLTMPPLVPLRPRWSPDGTRILFKGYYPGGPGTPFIVDAKGGSPTQLVKDALWHSAFADWSPDGRFAIADVIEEPGASPPGIYTVDLHSNAISLLPGSQGLTFPRWSPDGRYVAARSPDETKLFLFETRTQHWKLVVTGKLITRYDWNGNGQALYFQDILDPQETVFRFDVRTGKASKTTDFSKLLHNGAVRCAFEGFAPDGSMIASIRSNVGDIYALDLER